MTKSFPAQAPPPRSSLFDLANKPIVLCAISLAISLVLGGAATYTGITARISDTATRVEQMDRGREDQARGTREQLARIEGTIQDAQRNYLTKDEFRQFEAAVLRDLAEIKANSKRR